ncbi:MAG: hypothetical protein LBT18_00920 [Endomicrobium sp.]|jgi:hypothetical protein|nr:hypothetical protein [Endomicrobium sp.]
MKKLIYIFVLFVTLSVSVSVAFGDGSRYIVFFAESSVISQSTIDKMLLSKYFCVNVPINSITGVPKNLEELVSYGKIEPAVSFNPETVLPVLAMLSGIKSKKRGVFEEYISTNLADFANNTNREEFGIFLNHAEISHNILYYFTGLNLSWINADNAEGNIPGAYYIDGITVFSLYKDFPYNQEDIMNWLKTKRENIMPVLLTKKHLQNSKFMEYLINLFNNSNIKPATPSYISEVKKDLLQHKNIYFKQIVLDAVVMEKLYCVANLINNYADFNNFKEYAYNNARSELVYLCSWDLLSAVSADETYGKRMFDVAYGNIHRLLNSAKETKSKNLNNFIYEAKRERKDIPVLSGQTIVESIINGVAIYNKGLLNLIKIVSQDGGIKLSFSFEDGKWNESVSFVDLYIDLNNINGTGSTSLLAGINGFFTTESGWEYALRIYKDKAVLYKYSSDWASIVSNLPVNDNSVLISQKYIRGNPVNWGYQSIAVCDVDGKKTIIDFLNQSIKTKAEILSIKPFQFSTVRLRK